MIYDFQQTRLCELEVEKKYSYTSLKLVRPVTPANQIEIIMNNYLPMNKREEYHRLY